MKFPKKYLCVVCERELKWTPSLLFKEKTKDVWFMCIECNYAISESEIQRGLDEMGDSFDVQEID